MRSWARALAPIVVSAALLVALLSQLDADGLGARLAGLRWGWLALAAALGPAQVAIGGLRWGRVSAALGAFVAPRVAVAEVGLSTALNQVLPGGIGGDAVRVFRQRHHGALRVTAAAVIDRGLGLGALTVVTLVGTACWPIAHAGWPWALWLTAVGLAVGLVGALFTPIGAQARQVLRADGPAQLGLSLSLTVSFVVGFLLAGLAVGVGPGWWALTVAPWLLLAMAVPLSYAGWGPRELSAAVIWPLVGASPEEGVAVSAAYGLSVWLGALPGLLFWATPVAREERTG